MMEWFKKRRRGFAVAVGVAGVGYCGVQYVKSKLEAWQVAAAQKQAAQDSLRRRFAQLQENASLTTVALLPALLQQLCAKFDVDSLTSQLQSQRQDSASLSSSQVSEPLSASQEGQPDVAGQPPQPPLEASHDSQVLVHPTESLLAQTPTPDRPKSEIWQDIKILSFCRAFTAVYVTSLVACLTYTQLAILSRYAYVASVQQQAQTEQEQNTLESMSRMLFGQALDQSVSSPLSDSGVPSPPQTIDADTELHFLALSWWILHRGWMRVADQVQAAVNIVFSGMDLKTALSPQELQTAFLKVRYLVEGGVGSAAQSFTEALLPSTPEEELELQTETQTTQVELNPRSAALRAELADVIDSSDFQLTLKVSFDALFAQFAQSLDAAFTIPPHSEQAKFTELPERQARLVKLLPKASREMYTILNSNPNEYVEALGTVPELQALSAILLSATD